MYTLKVFYDYSYHNFAVFNDWKLAVECEKAIKEIDPKRMTAIITCDIIQCREQFNDLVKSKLGVKL